jgi:SAM-dependent methyltransferase
VGTDGLFLASRGYDVTLIDVDGPAFHFAQHRFRRRQLKARFVESRSVLPELDTSYDVIVCFDVFEHLPDPVAAARRLVEALRPGGLLVQQASFANDGHHPCHLAGGVKRFGGLRWHICLAGLGLRNTSGLMYRRTAGLERIMQRARYSVWLATGFWLVHVE